MIEVDVGRKDRVVGVFNVERIRLSAVDVVKEQCIQPYVSEEVEHNHMFS